MKKSEYELLDSQWDADAMSVDEEVIKNAVLYEKDLSIKAAFITFNVPEKLNALPIAALEYVGDLVREAEVDDDVKTIIFRGNGPCFGTGADASELGHYIGYTDPKPGERPKRPAQRQRILPDRNIILGAFTASVANCLKATISQVHGYCYGGHMQIALASDIVIASPDATFTHPAFRYLGAGPQDMFAWFETMGVRKSKEIMLTMRPLLADEAEQSGFVNKVVEREDLDKWVRDYAQAISMMPLDGIMIGKSMMRLMQEAQGKTIGEMIGWIGHGWATNLQFDEGDFNFIKERNSKGLGRTLKERDEAVAPFFRLGGRLPKEKS
jgi:enoyl-CoA hydratase